MPDKRDKTRDAVNTGTQYRMFGLERAGIDEEKRTIPLSFSSEEPYKRWWGTEILDHTPQAVRLSRLQQRGPLLLDHNPESQIGVVEDVELTKDKRGRAVVRFGKSARAEEVYQDVLDGIRGNVSVGYQIHRMQLVEEKDGEEIYRATDWEPFEVSLVSVPADVTVGVGRSASGDHITVIERDIEETAETEEKNNLPVTPEAEPATPIEEKQAMPENIEVKDQTEKVSNAQRDIDKIHEIADKHGAHQLAMEHIRAGKSLEEFVCALLERSGAKISQDTAEVGMTDKDQKRYSIVRALNALANPQSRTIQEAAAFERECSLAAEKKYKREAQGMIIPADVLMSTARRDLTVGTDADGGYLVGTQHLAGSFIDALRNRTMVMKMGARMLDGLVGNIAIPKLSAGATAYWVDPDSTTGPTESKQTFGQVALSPKTVGGMTDISRQLLQQSSPSVDMLIEDDLQKILAIAIDAAALHGTGSANQPTGVAATSGIGSVVGGTNGAAPDWSDVVKLWSEVAVDNADIGSLGYLTNAKVIGKLMTTDKGTDTGQYICNSFPNPEGFTNFAGMRAGVSNQVSSTLTKGGATGTASAIFFGNWADLIIGAWGGLDLTVDPYTHSSSGTLRVVALQDIDIAVRHAQSFSAMLDALTA